MPLGESGVAAYLADVPAGKGALGVEVIVNGGMDGGQFLQNSYAPETEYRPFPSPNWLMRILGP